MLKKTKYTLTTGFLIVFIVFVLLIQFDTYNRDRSHDPWDGVSIQWFYDNLDDDDRLKIRQAMDYAIPRQKIIDEILFSLALPIASPIGQNLEEFWDPTLEPRDYNLSKSLELLTEVFNTQAKGLVGVTEKNKEILLNVPTPNALIVNINGTEYNHPHR